MTSTAPPAEHPPDDCANREIVVGNHDQAKLAVEGAHHGSHAGLVGEANVDVWNDTHSGNDGAIGRLATNSAGSQVLGWNASLSDSFEWAAQEVLHC